MKTPKRIRAYRALLRAIQKAKPSLRRRKSKQQALAE